MFAFRAWSRSLEAKEGSEHGDHSSASAKLLSRAIVLRSTLALHGIAGKSVGRRQDRRDPSGFLGIKHSISDERSLCDRHQRPW